MEIAYGIFFSLLAVLLALLSISIHELGHALRMKKWGISMAEISLLGFGPVVWQTTWPQIFGTTPIRLRLVPLGAFVEPDAKGQEVFESLSYSKRTDINGGGIIANLVYALVLFVPFVWLADVSTIAKSAVEQESLYQNLLILSATALGVASFLIVGSRVVSAYLFPVLGILILAALVYGVLSVTSYRELQQGIGGPGALAEYGAGTYTYYGGLRGALATGALISIALALTNLLPFFPLDGGQILSDVIKLWTPNRFKHLHRYVQGVMLVPFLLLIITALSNDIVRFLVYAFSMSDYGALLLIVGCVVGYFFAYVPRHFAHKGITERIIMYVVVGASIYGFGYGVGIKVDPLLYTLFYTLVGTLALITKKMEVKDDPSKKRDERKLA